jgi:hypothetical protein
MAPASRLSSFAAWVHVVFASGTGVVAPWAAVTAPEPWLRSVVVAPPAGPVGPASPVSPFSPLRPTEDSAPDAKSEATSERGLTFADVTLFTPSLAWVTARLASAGEVTLPGVSRTAA